jgi:hypothetical protein
MSQEILLYNTRRLQAMVEDDAAFVAHMLGVFIRTVPPTAEKIRKAYSLGQLDEVRILAVGLRPAILDLEIHSLKDAVVRIAKMAGEESPSAELGGLIDLLCEGVLLVKGQMERELAR